MLLFTMFLLSDILQLSSDSHLMKYLQHVFTGQHAFVRSLALWIINNVAQILPMQG